MPWRKGIKELTGKGIVAGMTDWVPVQKRHYPRTAVENTLCMIDAVLKDVKATYTEVGGGGITEIRMMATNTYRVSISHEERIDLITYELEITTDGEVIIAKRTEGTRTPGQ
jgi:hypothetical protein